MKLFPQSEEASKFIQLSWEKIEELDVDGKKVQSVNNFASQPFTISGPEEIVYEAGLHKHNATRIILDATVTPNGAGATAAHFVVTVLAFKTDVTIPYGNTTVTVLRDNVSSAAASPSAGSPQCGSQSHAARIRSRGSISLTFFRPVTLVSSFLLFFLSCS
jgi:hypothetical protein